MYASQNKLHVVNMSLKKFNKLHLFLFLDEYN